MIRILFLAMTLCFFINDYAIALDAQKRSEETFLDLLLFRKEPLNPKEESRAAKLLQEGSIVYLKEIESIDIGHFRSLRGDTAISISSEIEMIKMGLSEMVECLEIPKNNPATLSSVVAWHIAARAIAINIQRMEDLEKFGLVKSEWHRELGMVLRGIFDTLIQPKLMDLVQFKRDHNN